MPPRDFAFWAKSLRRQICDSSALWSSISDLFDFWWEVLSHFFRSFLDWFQSIQTRRCHCLRLKDVLMFQASSYSAGKRTFQWMLLNNILWMAPDHQAVYLGDNYTLSLPYLIHVQCKNCHTYISHLRRRINIVIYYSTIMSFYHIRSRERAKYQAIIIIILFNNISVWFR